MSRVPLPDASEIVEAAPQLFESLAVDDLYAARAMDGLYASLPIELREFAILATARYYDAEYEWHHHVGVAREAGVDPATIRAIGGRNFEKLSEPTRVVVKGVRAQCAGRFTDDHYDALAGHYSTEDIVALSMLVGHYTGVGQFIAAMDLPLESEFVGWLPED